MTQDFDKLTHEFLNSPKAGKLSGKKKEIQNLVNSTDGQKIKEMIGDDAENLKKAVARGDMKTLQSALSGILKTDEGARLAKHISDMMK